MKLYSAVVLVTGANRGLGLEFARQALAAGAKKVYAAVRDPAMVKLEGVVAIRLDVTKPEQVAEAAAACSDVTVIINNAGIATLGELLSADSIHAARTMFETNVIGMLAVSQAFTPVLAKNGGGAFLNVLSVASWFSPRGLGAYAVSKSTAWNLTNGLRTELRQQGTQVMGLHVGFIDTDLTAGIDMPKQSTAFVVESAYAALERGASEVLIDEASQQVRQGLAANPGFYLDPALGEG